MADAVVADQRHCRFSEVDIEANENTEPYSEVSVEIYVLQIRDASGPFTKQVVLAISENGSIDKWF